MIARNSFGLTDGQRYDIVVLYRCRDDGGDIGDIIHGSAIMLLIFAAVQAGIWYGPLVAGVLFVSYFPAIVSIQYAEHLWVIKLTKEARATVSALTSIGHKLGYIGLGYLTLWFLMAWGCGDNVELIPYITGAFFVVIVPLGFYMARRMIQKMPNCR